MESLLEVGVVLRELGIECTNARGQPASLGSCSRERESLRASAPSSYFDDLTAGQGSSGVETEICGAQQGRGRVGDRSAFGAHVLPRGRQNAERWAHVVIGTGAAQPVVLELQDWRCPHERRCVRWTGRESRRALDLVVAVGAGQGCP